MDTHGRFGRFGITRLKSADDGFMFGERLFGYARVEHEAEDVEMHMLVVERVADQLVPSHLHDHIVKDCVLARELGVAGTLIAALGAPAHDARGLGQFGDGIRIEPRNGTAGGVGLKQEAKLIEVGELLGRDLRSRTITDKVGLADESLRLQASKRLADGGLRYAKFPGEIVNSNA